MSLGRKKSQQRPMFVAADELPKSAGHPFYGRLNALLDEVGFDRWIEELCRPYYAATMGRPSIPPGVFFRMMFVGFFEGIGSLRQIAWRCSDSLAVREFLHLPLTQRAPDDSSLTVIRQRFPVELFEEVFRFMIVVARKKKLLQGRKIAIDATSLEANAAMRSIVSREEGVSWRRYLRELAAKEGIAHASGEDATRFDRRRDRKKVSNQDWVSPSDPDSRITKLKDGRTRLAYKAEHAIDLESEIIVAAQLHGADQSDAKTLPNTLLRARANLKLAGSKTKVTELVADKGYHAAATLDWCERVGVRTYIPDRLVNRRRRWTDKPKSFQSAVYANQRRVQRAKGRRLQRLRSERVERGFAHTCNSGGLRRMTVRGLAESNKRYLLHIAGQNLAIVMRKLFGAGTPREWGAWSKWLRHSQSALLAIVTAVITAARWIAGRKPRSEEN
jgi:transposase